MTLETPRVDQISPEHRLRLRFKPKALATGYVDGAWWPYGDDLLAELPDLFAVLVIRLGPIHRVVYHLGEWATAPAKLNLRVRLDGYRHQPAHTLEVLGIGGGKITLLLIPPRANADSALMIMRTAADPNDVSTVDELLATIT